MFSFQTFIVCSLLAIGRYNSFKMHNAFRKSPLPFTFIQSTDISNTEQERNDKLVLLQKRILSSLMSSIMIASSIGNIQPVHALDLGTHSGCAYPACTSQLEVCMQIAEYSNDVLR